MIHTEELWNEVIRQTPVTPGCRVESLMVFLSSQVNPHAQLLTARPLIGEPDDSSARALESAVATQVQTGHITRYQAAQWMRWIHAAIKRIPTFQHPSEKTFDIHPTRLVVERQPVTSPFSPQKTALATHAAGWEVSLNAWLEELYKREFDAAEWSAGLALSAVLIGGLLDPLKLREFFRQIAHPLPRIGLRPYAEFHQKLGGHGDFHCQRWFVDPISELLLMRKPVDYAPPADKALLKSIRSLLASHGTDSVEAPTSLDMLVKHGVARWSQQTAQIDIEVMGRRIMSHAFHERTWSRLFKVSGHKAQPQNDNTETAEPTADQEFQADFDFFHPWFPLLRQVLSVPPKTPPSQIDLLNHLAKVGHPIESLSPVSKTLVCWVQALLTGKNCTNDRLAVSTILRLSQSVIPAISTRLDKYSDLKLSPDEVVELYEDAMGAAMGSERIHLAKGLREFHHHLVRTLGVKPLKSIRETLGEDAGLEPVDANPISVEEYFRARSYLDQQIRRGGDRVLLQIAKMVMTLAFRTGMRRSEAMGLLLEDIHGASKLEILIRPNTQRRLKTDSSKRIIPAGYLIPLAERREIQDWLSRRRCARCKGQSSDRLFAVELTDGIWREISDELTADRIMAALKHATGQPTKIHQLRHAFATWLYLGLRSPDYKEVLGLLEHLPETRAQVRRGARLRRLLLNQPGPTSRSYAYVVARLLGHSSPMVSMNSYIHSTEFIQRAVSIRKANQLPSASIRAIANLKPVWGNRLLEGGIEQAMNHLRSRKIIETSCSTTGIGGSERSQEHPSRAEVKRGRPKKIAPSDWISLTSVHELLHTYATSQTPLPDICKVLNLTLPTAEKIIGAAIHYGEAFGFKSSGERPLAYPEFVRTQAAKNAEEAIEKRLARAFARNQIASLNGTFVHLHHYNPSKRDVVFRGEKDADALVAYVKLLELMEFTRDDIQIVLRAKADTQTKAPHWSRKLLGPYRKSALNFNNPPVLEKADAYRSWVGLRMTHVDKTAWPSAVRAMMFMATVRA